MEAGKKAKRFASFFGALGVEYTLNKLHDGFFTAGNMPERLERIGRMVEKIKDDRSVGSTEAASIHWLIEFRFAFHFGQVSSNCFPWFSMLSSGYLLTADELMDLCGHTSIVL